MKACFKWLKTFLALEIKNLGSLVVLLLPNCPLFIQLLNLVDFFDAFNSPILSLLSELLPLTTLLLSILEVNAIDDLVFFNITVKGAVILLKS